MRKLRITKDDAVGYDLEYTTKPVLFIKGLGKKCPVCGRHIVGRSDKTTCSPKCTKRIGYIKNKDKWNINSTNSLKCRISIKKIEGKNEYRTLSIYLKKGVVHKLKINAKYGELWEFVEKIQNFRMNPIGVAA